MNDLAVRIREIIVDYVNISDENRLGGPYLEKAWGSPLVGFSLGGDPLYSTIKEVIGEFYWTPEEIFLKTYPGAKIQQNDLTVICWVLPHTLQTKQGMRQETLYPSKRASFARVNGETFNLNLGKYVVDTLGSLGYQAVAPVQSPFWARIESDKHGLASCWSERHAAYVSGLGTFSLTDALITSQGMAVRLGSVIANIAVEPTKRSYSTYNEYCLFFSTGGCLKCAQRCPAGAINEQGHNKSKCREYQKAATSIHNKQQYGLEANYCGICQAGIPCESCIPANSLMKNSKITR
ncbi:hypothetical protein SPSIL_046440 [Sporomusa silvacetica DSM 10669]|uniref:Epoxyqueuosine reductase n=1 Tax=Sporomusa silvacetica DSM 10669 TaxID=1123289 RepID=A0ABZ3IRW7_9FIRM|nr:hypothetical protein [Sporomusa silvacetica]OZC15313.1 hypothetical protein SPSIL_41910 [Sporomusa silvacetica DSM 10669]